MTGYKKVALISRFSKDNLPAQANPLLSLLKDKFNLDVYLNDTFAKNLGYSKSIKMTQLSKFDLIIALGGDGTILWTSRYANHTPILGINAGHLGFLTTATMDSYPEAIERFMMGDYILERCMRLRVILDGKNLPSALNETYITNMKAARIVKLNINVNNYNLGRHSFDGILISTPVGSTAYAMSAGGAIIEHKIQAMQIVPVNSVDRRIRPFVIPGESKVIISVPDNFEGEVIIVNDGVYQGKLKKGSSLEITKSDIETIFIRFPDHGFFKRLQDKLGF